MADSNRGHMLQIRVSDQEMKELRRVAKLRDLGVSELVRVTLARSFARHKSDARKGGK